MQLVSSKLVLPGRHTPLFPYLNTTQLPVCTQTNRLLHGRHSRCPTPRPRPGRPHCFPSLFHRLLRSRLEALPLLLLLYQELPHHLQNLLVKLITIEMAHVTCIWKGDPADAGNELEIWHLRNIPRCVKLPVVDQSGSSNLRQAWYASPATQRAVQVQNRGPIPME